MSADRDRSGAGSGAHARVPGAAEAEQLGERDLLPLAIPETQRRGPGRPRGSGNIRTEKTAQVILSRYGDPLIASAAIGNMPLRELVTELRTVASDCGLKLGATVMDVARWQAECRRDVLPFIHAKRAPETGDGTPVLPVIGIGRADQVTINQAPGRSIEAAIEAEQNQGVTIDAAAVSHGEKSHDDASD